MGKYPRDSQRAKVFAAEEATFAAFGRLRMLARTEISKEMGHAIASPWFKSRSNVTNLTCYYTRHLCGGAPRLGAAGALSKTRSGWTHCSGATGLLGVCHVLAHVISPPAEHHALHGPEFINTFIEATKELVGADAARTLKQEMALRQVKTNIITPEQYAEKKRKAQERKELLYAKKEATLQTNLVALIRKYR